MRHKRNIIIKIGFLVAMVVMALPAGAITTMRLITADGSWYCGYIERQGPALETIVFQADSFVSRVARASLYGSEGNYSVPLDEGNTIVPVTILKDEGDSLTYSCRIPHVFNILAKDMVEIEAAPNYKTQITGVDRIYRKYTGETVEGSYDGEVIGKSIRIVDSLGVTHLVGAADYESCRYVGHFPDESLYEQSPLLDRITTADGVYTGVVSETHYVMEPEQDFYLFVDGKDGVRQRVRIPGITLYEKIPNPDYKPQFVNDLSPGRVVINGKYAFFIPLSKNYQKSLYTVLVPKDKTVTIKTDGNVAKVSMEICPEEGTVEKDQFVLLHLKQAVLRRYKLEDESTFSVQPSSFVLNKSSNTAKYVFEVDATFIDPLKPGSYAILDKVNLNIIPVFIQK